MIIVINMLGVVFFITLLMVVLLFTMMHPRTPPREWPGSAAGQKKSEE